MGRLIPISKAAKILGVSIATLCRWEAEGKIQSVRTEGKHRRYDLTGLNPALSSHLVPDNRKTIAYARVSSHDQKEDLQRQKEVLEIITVFSARLYGSRSRKNQKLLTKLKQATEDVNGA